MIAIRTEKLGKKYILSHGQGERYTALRDVISDKVKSAGRRLLLRGGGRAKRSTEEFWALRDVSFEVEQGGRVGIIGRNGAGKSTLLKILSRIVEPTEGRVQIKGRTSSLLEVGTGFHPELTGRENIYLNGAILGMSKADITRKFDEIVAFAEVEQFLDTPVKRYSSGMFVRLAFSVAAHLEPDILIVDEVLAVGDAQFQKKCLGKMEAVSGEGRTVLFVSHNMAAIQYLCSKALLLDKGKLVFRGEVNDVIGEYIRTISVQDRAVSSDLRGQKRDNNMTPVFFEGHVNGEPLIGNHSFLAQDGLKFEFIMNFGRRMKETTVGIHFDNQFGARVYAVNTRWALKRINFSEGRYKVECLIDKMPLVPGPYYISLGFSEEGQQVDWLEKISVIKFEPADVYGTGELPGSGQGYFLSHADWNVSQFSPK